MDGEVDAVRDVVAKHIQYLMGELRSFLIAAAPAGKIAGGVSTYDPHKVDGLVFYRPHNDPEEENLEAAIVIKLENGTAKLVADICWSDGEIVSDIAERDVTYTSLSEFLQEVDKFAQSVSMEMLRQMKVLIDPSRPPRYSSH